MNHFNCRDKIDFLGDIQNTFVHFSLTTYELGKFNGAITFFLVLMENGLKEVRLFVALHQPVQTSWC